MNGKKLRIGIIGTGSIAHAHANSYKKYDDVEIVAGADIIPGKARAFLDEFGWKDAKAFENHKDLCDMDLDAVSVCTYNTAHAIPTIDALNSGKHVLCEKPMCVTIEEAVEMCKAEKKSKKILTIGFQPRYDENCKKVKNIIQSGELGKIYYVQTGGSRRRGIPGHTFIDKDKAFFGALGDLGCYSLDFALNSIGYPKPLTVSACATDYFGKNPKYYNESERFSVDDFSSAYIRLEGDIIFDFRMAWAMHMDICSDFIFLGTEAGLRLTPPDPIPLGGCIMDGNIGKIVLYHDQFGEPTNTVIPKSRNYGDNFEKKIRGFVDAVKNNLPAPIPTKQIIYNQAIIDGIVRSSRSHKEVDIVIPEI